MSYSGYSKCSPLARMQVWRHLRYWSIIVNNALLHSSSIINHTLLKIVYILHFCLVDSLLHYVPDFIFN